jgi:hypothetical protein
MCCLGECEKNENSDYNMQFLFVFDITKEFDPCKSVQDQAIAMLSLGETLTLLDHPDKPKN